MSSVGEDVTVGSASLTLFYVQLHSFCNYIKSQEFQIVPFYKMKSITIVIHFSDEFSVVRLYLFFSFDKLRVAGIDSRVFFA